MDLEENIRIAAEVYQHQKCYVDKGIAEECIDCFIAGAKSQAAKDYWYNEFKRQKIQSDSGQDQTLRNQPLRSSECFNGKSEHQMIFGTGDGLTDQEKLDIEYGITPLGRQHRQYLKDNPDKPMSFDNWKYMVEHYPNEEYKWNEMSEQLGWKEYQLYCIENPNEDLSFEEWKDMMDKYNRVSKEMIQEIANEVLPKRIGIIGHVDHGSHIFKINAREKGKTLLGEQIAYELDEINKANEKGIIIMGSTSEVIGPIQSIVPIADIIPEPIISKQEFLEMHDKAVERSITEEAFKESRAWDIKKEKKVSHKRNNKRRK